MPVTIEGFLDDGRGEPVAGIPAVATILGTSTVVDTTMTDANGHWLFTDLPTADEYVVELTDTAGNAVARAPWSGQMRELSVRDRLDVAGLPVLLDPAAGNALLWTATGLYAPTGLTQAQADARYPLKTDVDPYPTYLTSTEADALFLTPAEGNAAYATSAHNHDAAYVNVTGDTLSGALDFGAAASQSIITSSSVEGLLFTSAPASYARVIWYRQMAKALVIYNSDTATDLFTVSTGGNAILLGSLTVATKPVAISPDGSNIIEWRANGFYAAAGAVSDIWVNTTGDTMTGDLNMTANVLPTVTNTRDLGSTSLRWRKLWAVDGEFTNAPTVGGSALLTQATADALFLTPAEGTAAYVSLHGSTMDGELWFSMGQPTVAMWEGDAPTNNRSLKIYMPSNDGRLRVAAQRDDGVEGTSVLEVRRSGNDITTLRIGTVASDPAFPAAYTGQPGLLVQHEGATDINSLSLGRAASDTTAETMNAWRSRGTWASKVAIANGDFLFDINSWGWSGANWLRSAIIRTVVAGTVTTTAVPTSMTFYTADSAGTLATRLSIGPDGLVGVGARALGTAAAQLDVQATAAASAGLIVRNHASAAAGLVFLSAHNGAGSLVILGANNTGWVTDAISATAIGSYATKRIPIYNSSGTLQGYVPIYN